MTTTPKEIIFEEDGPRSVSLAGIKGRNCRRRAIYIRAKRAQCRT